MAQSTESTPPPSQAAPAPAPAPSAAPAVVKYNYQAQPGDSYTQMARKAIQTYGLKSGVKLSHAKIIYAETNMTIEAGSPLLDVNQAVSFEEAKVKAWADKAAALDAATEKLWQYYVQFVDFNTNRVGQAG